MRQDCLRLHRFFSPSVSFYQCFILVNPSITDTTKYQQLKASIKNTQKTVTRNTVIFTANVGSDWNSHNMCCVAGTHAAHFCVQFCSTRPFLAAADVFSFRIVGWLIATWQYALNRDVRHVTNMSDGGAAALLVFLLFSGSNEFRV